MTSHQEDIATKLLHSSDARIAEAAKRVFSSTLPAAAASLAAFSFAASSSTAASAFEESSIHVSEVDQYDQNHPCTDSTLHGGAEHTANMSSGAVESTAANDEVAEDLEESDKKPSSTERLKRR